MSRGRAAGNGEEARRFEYDGCDQVFFFRGRHHAWINVRLITMYGFADARFQKTSDAVSAPTSNPLNAGHFSADERARGTNGRRRRPRCRRGEGRDRGGSSKKKKARIHISKGINVQLQVFRVRRLPRRSYCLRAADRGQTKRSRGTLTEDLDDAVHYLRCLVGIVAVFDALPINLTCILMLTAGTSRSFTEKPPCVSLPPTRSGEAETRRSSPSRQWNAKTTPSCESCPQQNPRLRTPMHQVGGQEERGSPCTRYDPPAGRFLRPAFSATTEVR